MTSNLTNNQLLDDQTAPARASRHSWRVVDIVVAAVLGVACGLIFFAWNSIGYAWFTTMDALTPGLGGIAAGIWFLGGPLGMLIIRKPGAAILVELIGAIVSALLGNVWGITTLYSGLAQGLGAELVFALFAYRNFKLPVALLAGAGAGLGAWTLELFTSGNLAKARPSWYLPDQHGDFRHRAGRRRRPSAQQGAGGHRGVGPVRVRTRRRQLSQPP